MGAGWTLGRRLLALGLVLLLPSLVGALLVGWLWELLGWWHVNHPLLAWRWAAGWVLGWMAGSVVVDLVRGLGPPGPSLGEG